MMETDASRPTGAKPERHLLVALLQGYYWFDEGLQSYLRSRGWPDVTRPQSMVMANLADGLRRPVDIARRLGVSRQAIHVTLNQMIEMGVLALESDPTHGRAKQLALTPLGEEMRRDAIEGTRRLYDELQRRLGIEALEAASALLNREWGPPMNFDAEG